MTRKEQLLFEETPLQTTDTGVQISSDKAARLFDADQLCIGYTSDAFSGTTGIPLVKPHRHTLVVGETGTGKTTLLRNLASQLPAEDSFLLTTSSVVNRSDFIQSEPIEIGSFDSEVYGVGLFSNTDDFTIQEQVEIIYHLLTPTDTEVSETLQGIIKDVIQLVIITEDAGVETLKDCLTDASTIQSLLEQAPENETPPTVYEDYSAVLNNNIDHVKNGEHIPFRQQANKLTSDYCKYFLEEGEKRTFTVSELEELIERGTSFVVNQDMNATMQAVFELYYCEAIKRLNTNGSQTTAHILSDEPQGNPMQKYVINTYVPQSRSLNLAWTVTRQTLDVESNHFASLLSKHCRNLLLFRVNETLTANSASMFFNSYDRNHFMNQETFRFTAKLATEYVESTELTGTAIPPLTV